MTWIVGLLTKFISKEVIFTFIKGVVLEVLAEPIYDATCTFLDEAVKSTETTLDDEIAANLKEFVAEKLDI